MKIEPGKICVINEKGGKYEGEFVEVIDYWRGSKVSFWCLGKNWLVYEMVLFHKKELQILGEL